MRSTALLLLLLLAGCGSGPAPLPTGRINAFFPPGGVADAIEVSAVDRLALREAALVAPDGAITAAQSIVAQPAPTGGSALALPSTIDLAGGLTAGPEDAPRFASVGSGVQSESRLLATLSQATIVLPDPAAYRRNWRGYRIRLRFGVPPDTDTREIAAPEPPPVAGTPP